MKNLLVFGVLLFFLFSSEAKPKENLGNRIVGGDVAFVGQFPYLAAIYITTRSGVYFCGGTLLNNQWILTAGSCVNDAVSFDIHLGTNSLKADGPNVVHVATEEYVLHPDFNLLTLDNDIGLIKLRIPITFSMYVRPVNNLADSDLEAGTQGTVAMGWGQIDDENSGLVDDLRYVYLTPISNEECKLAYGNQINDQMVCVNGNYNEGFCNGDSGTPLVMIRHGPVTTHVGIASFLSNNGCNNTDPSGYTRTFPYVDWIRNVTQI